MVCSGRFKGKGFGGVMEEDDSALFLLCVGGEETCEKRDNECGEG